MMSLVSKIRNRGIKVIIKKIKAKFLTVSNGYILNLNNYNMVSYEEKYNCYALIPMQVYHLKKMVELYGNQISNYKYEILKKRIAEHNKHIPYVVVDKEGDLYGYFHLSIGDTRDGTINIDVQVNKNTVYLFDDYTFLEKRGNGVHKFSVYSRLDLAKKLGYSKAIVNILKGNLYSERSYQGLGFIKNLVYYYVHVLNFKKTFMRVVKK
ncbi:hypothetical protein [Bacillus cereus]|uniref:hypothetical protein n=1 Tax=Bacillus cereus TaxID=1396 RepID=UPI00187AFDA3|nr:hypothetical protein [Bacillus cereus]MBE7097076.1 hypothetical protein [Bacillus cereus]